MLNRLAGSQPAWTCAWACMQIRGIATSSLQTVDASASHADASEAGSKPQHGQQDTRGHHSESGAKRKKQRREASLYDEFYNVYFEDLNASDSQRSNAWDQTAGRQASSSSSSRSKASSSSSSQTAHQASSSREREPHQGKRGMSWFARHWAGAGLSLDDIENLEFLQQRQSGKSRSRRNKGAGSRNQEARDNVWEDDSGFRWTEARPASSSRSYQRAFAEHERSWFEAWQASNAYSSNSSSSSSSQHPGKGSTYQWYHKQGSGAAWEQQHSPAANSPAVAGHLFALGLASDVSLCSLDRASLRQAFHLVAKQWHPDRHADQASKAAAEVKFKRAAEAYEELLKHSAA